MTNCTLKMTLNKADKLMLKSGFIILVCQSHQQSYKVSFKFS